MLVLRYRYVTCKPRTEYFSCLGLRFTRGVQTSLEEVGVVVGDGSLGRSLGWFQLSGSLIDTGAVGVPLVVKSRSGWGQAEVLINGCFGLVFV